MAGVTEWIRLFGFFTWTWLECGVFVWRSVALRQPLFIPFMSQMSCIGIPVLYPCRTASLLCHFHPHLKQTHTHAGTLRVRALTLRCAPDT